MNKICLVFLVLFVISSGCSKSIKNGHGVEITSDGRRFEGEFRGYNWDRGTLIYPNGDRYEGEFNGGRLYGHGIFKWADGKSYDGEFRNGKLNGRGIYTWLDGQRYEGEFEDNNYNGWGVLKLSDGRRYEGEWSNDQKSGRGIYIWPDGMRYEGEFGNDVRNGRGVQTWPDGHRYEGEWSNDQKNGHGVMRYADGSIYDGVWKDDQPAPTTESIVYKLCKIRGSGKSVEDLACENSSHAVANENNVDGIKRFCEAQKNQDARTACYRDAEELLPPQSRDSISSYAESCHEKNGKSAADCYSEVYTEFGVKLDRDLQAQKAKKEQLEKAEAAARQQEEARAYAQGESKRRQEAKDAYRANCQSECDRAYHTCESSSDQQMLTQTLYAEINKSPMSMISAAVNGISSHVNCGSSRDTCYSGCQ